MARHRLAFFVPAIALVGGLGAGCDRLATKLRGPVSPEAGLLRGKVPSASDGVTHVARLTDGIASATGDPGRTDLTALLTSADAFATWDLGAETPVRCALLAADGDDRYRLSISSDGATFAPLWAPPPDEDKGQQLLVGRDLPGAGRYLRLEAGGGDGRFAVSEVSAWRDCPTSWPALAMQAGEPDDESVRLKLWAFAAFGVAYVLLYRRRAPDGMKLLGVVPAGLGVALAIQLRETWPPPPEVTSRLVVVAVALAVAAGGRLALARRAAKTASPPAA